MIADAMLRATTLIALYDDAGVAGRAAEAVCGAGLGATVHRIDPDGAEADRLARLALPAGAIDPYLASLGRGRTLVAVEVGEEGSGRADAILRRFDPVEAARHDADGGRDTGKDEDSGLPPAIESTAAQTRRPRGHMDPSA